tara:strand:- start:485 stop:715 length:231 start_codon:yes stop_codon:yes gene_type:complete
MAWRLDVWIDAEHSSDGESPEWLVAEASISDYLVAVGMLRRYKRGNPVTNAVDGKRREFPEINEDPANDRVRLVEI